MGAGIPSSLVSTCLKQQEEGRENQICSHVDAAAPSSSPLLPQWVDVCSHLDDADTADADEKVQALERSEWSLRKRVETLEMELALSQLRVTTEQAAREEVEHELRALEAAMVVADVQVTSLQEALDAAAAAVAKLRREKAEAAAVVAAGGNVGGAGSAASSVIFLPVAAAAAPVGKQQPQRDDGNGEGADYGEENEENDENHLNNRAPPRPPRRAPLALA